MTRIVGNDGNMWWATAGAPQTPVPDTTTVNARFNSWSMSVEQVLLDTTAFVDDWRRRRGGLKGATGSASGVLAGDENVSAPNIGYTEDGTEIQPGGHPLTLVVSPFDGVSNACSFNGIAVVGNVTISSDKTAEAGLTMDFAFDGVVAEAWDESPPG